MDPVVVPLLMLGVVGVVLANRAWKRLPDEPEGPDLPPELAGRLREVREVAEATRAASERRDMGPLLADQLGRQADMVAAYERMTIELANLRRHLKDNPRDEVKRQYAKALKRKQDEALGPLKERLDLLEQAEATKDTLKAQLKGLDASIRLVHDRAVATAVETATPPDFTRDVAAADAAIAEVRALLARQPER